MSLPLEVKKQLFESAAGSFVRSDLFCVPESGIARRTFCFEQRNRRSCQTDLLMKLVLPAVVATHNGCLDLPNLLWPILVEGGGDNRRDENEDKKNLSILAIGFSMRCF